MKNKIKAIFMASVIFLAACKKKDIVSDFPPLTTTSVYSFDSDANSSLMLKDGEELATMTSDSRIFEIGKVLRIRAVDETTIEISNFAPVDIDDAIVLLTIKGMPKAIKLLKVKKIRAHATQTVKYPFVKGTSKFLDADNAEVDLSKYQTGIPVGEVSFDFTGETQLIKKLKKLAKLKWKIKYHDFDANDNPADNWKENPDAKDFRRFSGFIINLAYLFQDERTKDALINEPITKNDGTTFLSTAEKETVYQQFLDIERFNCGVVANVSGLGGGYTFGVADHILRDYLTKDICYVSVHEVGHMLGYNHSSSMTYPKDDHGAVVATGKVYSLMLKDNELPINKTNYYKQSDL